MTKLAISNHITYRCEATVRTTIMNFKTPPLKPKYKVSESPEQAGEKKHYKIYVNSTYFERCTQQEPINTQIWRDTFLSHTNKKHNTQITRPIKTIYTKSHKQKLTHTHSNSLSLTPSHTRVSVTGSWTTLLLGMCTPLHTTQTQHILTYTKHQFTCLQTRNTLWGAGGASKANTSQTKKPLVL
jgi:hypothetical protein